MITALFSPFSLLSYWQFIHNCYQKEKWGNSRGLTLDSLFKRSCNSRFVVVCLINWVFWRIIKQILFFIFWLFFCFSLSITDILISFCSSFIIQFLCMSLLENLRTLNYFFTYMQSLIPFNPLNAGIFVLLDCSPWKKFVSNIAISNMQ